MKNNEISVVIPVLNEGTNIYPLVHILHNTFALSAITYELIFIDDHSSDNTFSSIEKLVKHFPISVYHKLGAKGKAQSLLEGFTYAKYPLIGIIDADLQYPPEAIPYMMSKINIGADIVVAERHFLKVGIARKLTSFAFRTIFGKWLHDLECDVQSGLKVFKKEIVQKISLNPTPWTFDLEFLVKARSVGYKIESVDINFQERWSGNSKINVFKSSLEIGYSAIKIKTQGAKVIPFSTSNENEKSFYYRGNKFSPFSDLSHQNNAFKQFHGKQALFASSILAFALFGFYLNWHTSLTILLSTLTVLYFADLLFNLFLISKSLTSSPEIEISNLELEESNFNWPMYSVLCPLYKEWSVLPQFIKAMENMDYPTNKLQVLLLLEEDDTESLKKLSQVTLPKIFEVIVIPHSAPKTKPKALNYGLQYVKGKYAVIYDAEDIPEPDQIKKAVLAFSKSPESTICLQAKLNFYNPRQNLLTRLFTAEYLLWFNLVLPGLQAINAPIPLGGTSNHFKVKDLITLKGWDAFNVTEDCDLGMRMVKSGFKTAIINSTTFEEANSNFPNWIKQRSRWIQGYMQTYLVHTRTTGDFAKDGKISNIPAFALVVGGKVLSIFVNPLMWLFTLIYFIFRPIAGPFIESLFPGPVLYIGVASFVFGNFLYLYYYMIAAAKKGNFDLIKYLYFVPFYWLAMSFAGSLALFKIIFNPHYWSKTIHGLHLDETENDFGDLVRPELAKSSTVSYSKISKTPKKLKRLSYEN